MHRDSTWEKGSGDFQDIAAYRHSSRELVTWYHLSAAQSRCDAYRMSLRQVFYHTHAMKVHNKIWEVTKYVHCFNRPLSLNFMYLSSENLWNNLHRVHIWHASLVFKRRYASGKYKSWDNLHLFMRVKDW